MFTFDDRGQFVGIRCEECDRAAPPAREILNGHGLVNMGWECHGGKHICPECRRGNEKAISV